MATLAQPIDAERTRRKGFSAVLLGYAAALIIGLVAMAAADAWRAGFSGADESAHFLNSWFIAAYAQQALGADPMGYAAEYYLHYPKISIGHWPPGYYGLLAPLFLLIPPTPAAAFAINLAVSALPSALIAIVLGRTHGRIAALVGAALLALTPIMLEAQAFFMVDAPLAAAVLAATILWSDYLERGGAWRVFAFAALATLAVLMKGNGWLLALMPPLHIAVTGRWAVLRSPALWLAALLAAAIVGPWYWLTAGISADGFNHEAGLAYASEALAYNVGALFAATGPAPLLAAVGLAAAWRRRADEPRRWSLLSGMAALVLATLLLQSLVPVDLDARYMAPAIPPLIALAVAGLAAMAPRLRWLAALAALATAAPGVAHLVTRQPKIDLRLDEAAAFVPQRPTAWIVDGTSGAEGAAIAAMAVRDPALQSYAVRSSKLLARSDFMGNDYALVTRDPAEVLARLQRLGIGGIVIARIGGEPAFPHSAVLRAAVTGTDSPYRLAARLAHRNRPGVTEIYLLPRPIAPNAGEIRALGMPSKARALSGN